MKNLIKLMGIIAIVAVIGFAFVACPEPEEEGGPTSFGDKLEFTNEQVYVLEQKREGDKLTLEYKPYSGPDITFDSVFGAAPKIAGGKFSFSVGVPAAQYLESISEWFPDDDTYTDLKISDTTVKYVTISSFRKESPYAYLSRQNYDSSNITVSGSGENMTYTGSATMESVSFVYVDKAVTITGKGKTKTVTYEAGATYIDKYNDINLSLAKGWNTVCSKGEGGMSGSATTITQSVNNPSSAKWLVSTND